MNENQNPNFSSFTMFISGLMAEGLVSLGAMEHPITKKQEKNLTHASFVIDTLEMLQEKTKGNLDDQENSSLEEVLHQLRMLYVSETKPKEENKVEEKQEEKQEEKKG